MYNVYFLCRVVASIHEAFYVPASFAKVLSKSIAYKIFLFFSLFLFDAEKNKLNKSTIQDGWQLFSARCRP